MWALICYACIYLSLINLVLFKSYSVLSSYIIYYCIRSELFPFHFCLDHLHHHQVSKKQDKGQYSVAVLLCCSYENRIKIILQSEHLVISSVREIWCHLYLIPNNINFCKEICLWSPQGSHISMISCSPSRKSPQNFQWASEDQSKDPMS